nr:30S ribosomal protein S8 [Marinitoga litoralis]
MMWSDPVADMLTRIRNANLVMKESVEIPASNLKRNIAEILKREGYITDYKFIEDGKQGILKIQLKYKGDRKNKQHVIHSIIRVSKPGRRVYVSKDRIPVVKGGMGISIISTSKGVLTDKEARELGVGGELICYVW